MLRTWLTKNNLWTRSGEPCSHTSMDGWRFKIGPDRREQFHRVYAESIREGERLQIVERNWQSTFNFYVDIDFMDHLPMDYEMIVDIGSMCQSVINPKDTVILCTTRLRKKNNLTKTGIHLHWNHVVTHNEVPNIIKTILDRLNKRYPAYKWKDFVDTTVYKTGLRMKWSYKKDKDASPYFPKIEYTKTGYRMIPETVSLWMLTQLSIHDGECKNVVDFENKCRQGFTPSQTMNKVEASSALEGWIQKNMKGQGSARALCLYAHDHSLLVKTNSKYCHRIQKEHKNNHVYFYIDLKLNTICQKCFDDECNSVTKDKDGNDVKYQTRNKSIPVNIIAKHKLDPFKTLLMTPQQSVMNNLSSKRY